MPTSFFSMAVTSQVSEMTPRNRSRSCIHLASTSPAHRNRARQVSHARGEELVRSAELEGGGAGPARPLDSPPVDGSRPINPDRWQTPWDRGNCVAGGRTDSGGELEGESGRVFVFDGRHDGRFVARRLGVFGGRGSAAN